MKIAEPTHTIKTFKQRTKTTANVQKTNNSIINRSSDIIFSQVLGVIHSTVPCIGLDEIGVVGIVHIRDGKFVLQLQYNGFQRGQGRNNVRINTSDWKQTMMKLVPQHPHLHIPKDTTLQNSVLTLLNNIITHYYLNGLQEGDRRRFARELAVFTLLAFGSKGHSKTIISSAYDVQDRATLDKHYGNISYTGQRVLNILYVWLKTDVINDIIIQRLPPAFKQLFHAIKENKTGVTTVYDAPYSGNELTNILMDNLRESQDNPMNITFEDAMCTWANEMLEYKNVFAATDDTGIENGVFAAFGIPTAMFGIDGELS